MKKSKTNSGFLYFLEKIVRSHPLLYFVVRYFIRYTNIFEEDANGVAFLNLNKKVNIIDVGASDGISSKFFNKKLKISKIICFEPNKSYVKILKKLLKNDELLEKYTNKFTTKVFELWEDKNNFKPIYNTIEKLNHRKVKLIKFPYWYLRIAAKQIMLRNIKLSTFIKTIFQFNIIFSIIRNSNFIVKFLVTLESIVNTLWYSFTLTIKPKK